MYVVYFSSRQISNIRRHETNIHCSPQPTLVPKSMENASFRASILNIMPKHIVIYRQIGLFVFLICMCACMSVFICPIAIAYSMGHIIKSVCVCLSVCVSVHLRALSRSHFLIDFHQNWHRRKNPEK